MQTEQMQNLECWILQVKKALGKNFTAATDIFYVFLYGLTCHRLRRYFHLRLTVCSDRIFFHTAFLISNRYHAKELSTPWLW